MATCGPLSPHEDNMIWDRPPKTNVAPSKMVVGALPSIGESLFSGAISCVLFTCFSLLADPFPLFLVLLWLCFFGCCYSSFGCLLLHFLVVSRVLSARSPLLVYLARVAFAFHFVVLDHHHKSHHHHNNNNDDDDDDDHNNNNNNNNNDNHDNSNNSNNNNNNNINNNNNNNSNSSENNSNNNINNNSSSSNNNNSNNNKKNNNHSNKNKNNSNNKNNKNKNKNKNKNNNNNNVDKRDNNQQRTKIKKQRMKPALKQTNKHQKVNMSKNRPGKEQPTLHCRHSGKHNHYEPECVLHPCGKGDHSDYYMILYDYDCNKHGKNETYTLDQLYLSPIAFAWCHNAKLIPTSAPFKKTQWHDSRYCHQPGSYGCSVHWFDNHSPGIKCHHSARLPRCFSKCSSGSIYRLQLQSQWFEWIYGISHSSSIIVPSNSTHPTCHKKNPPTLYFTVSCPNPGPLSSSIQIIQDVKNLLYANSECNERKLSFFLTFSCFLHNTCPCCFFWGEVMILVSPYITKWSTSDCK